MRFDNFYCKHCDHIFEVTSDNHEDLKLKKDKIKCPDCKKKAKLQYGMGKHTDKYPLQYTRNTWEGDWSRGYKNKYGNRSRKAKRKD